MGAWKDAGHWLAGIADRVGSWAADGQIPADDAAKLLSLVALRQHQNGFEDAVGGTLAELGKLTLPVTNDVLWFSDAARMTDNEMIAIELESALLAERRLPTARVAPLMEEVAKLSGAEVALDLGENAAAYTMERDFLKTMVDIATAAGDTDRAAIWQDRQTEVQKLAPKT